jgi:hypothetical protein
MRPAMCTKRGSDVPFRRINADPFDPEDDLTASFAPDDVLAILPSLVSTVDKSKPTMRLLKTTPTEGKGKRTSSQASLDAASGRDARPRTTSNPAAPLTYSPKLANEVADQLVGMHPDGIGSGYDTWKTVMFGAIHTAGAAGGAPPEFGKVLKEFTRIRDGDRDQELGRIAAGTYASKGGITMGSLVFNQKQYPAACISNRASNADPLPDCRALLAPEGVELFDLFEKFLRHVVYEKTSFKWLVQFASYVVPTLKAQVYDTIQGGYEGITEDDFDLVWDGAQPSQIYEFAFKRYLAEIVGDINAVTPLVETTTGEPAGEATADGTSNPQETVTTVSHVRTSKPKARAGAPKKRFTKEEVITLIVKTSASVHSFESREVLRNAIHGALKGQQDVDKDTEELLGLWALLQGKSSKTTRAAQDEEEMERDYAEEDSNDAASEAMPDDDTEGNITDDASMVEADGEGHSEDVPMPDAGAVGGSAAEERDYMTLPELAAKYPSFILKQDWTPESRTVSPETHMVDILVNSLDPQRVMDHRTLLRTCRLLQLGEAPGVDETPITNNETPITNNDETPITNNNTTSIPKKLADFVEQCSKVRGLPFVLDEVVGGWRAACNDIKEGGGWKPLADALFADVFNRLCSYNAVKECFERTVFRVTEWDGFGSLNSKGQVSSKTKAQLDTNYEYLSFWKMVVVPKNSKEEGRVEVKSLPFLKVWKRDDKVKKFVKVDCIPPGCEVEPGVFNTWPGFRAEKLPAVPDDQVDELIRPVIEHLRNVICANEKELQFFLAWKAQQVQHPGKKSEVGIILSGVQGAGKNITTSWYQEKVLGLGVTTQTGTVRSILGKHSTALQNKVLCLFDEANYESLKPYTDEIKNMMTGPTLDIDPKFKDPYPTRNLLNLLFTTNNDKSVHLEAGDRRWAVFECNDSKKDDTAYFTKLLENLTDRSARAFYQFLLKFDLSDYGNFQAKRPHTQIYKDMKEGNLPVFFSFLSHECMSYTEEKQLFSPAESKVGGSTEKPDKTPEKKPESYTSQTLFDKLKTWATDTNFEIGSYNVSNFGKDFTELMRKEDSGVTKKRGALKGKFGKIYTIEWCKLEKCLSRHGLFNNSV